MSVHSILNQYLNTELPRSLQVFLPELVLCGTILMLLLVRMFNLQRLLPTYSVALIGSLAAFFAISAQLGYLLTGPGEGGLFPLLYNTFNITEEGVGTVGPYFSGLMMHDHFAVFFRMGLGLFLVFVVVLTSVSGIPDNEDGQDFYTLLLGSTLGMMLATGANHLLMLFVSIEMMSVPSYVMVGFLKGRKLSSEAALKYVVYGAGTAGVMLYGTSLIAGLLGTGSMPELGPRFAYLVGDTGFTLTNPPALILVLGMMMVFVGIAFKLSLVPFHFWCPDAFEGASAEVAGFLSVASKGAAFALLVRFAASFAGNSPALEQLGLFCGLALGVISILSMTLGNLAAYTQDNLKRMLAYSTIAHAGYMVMAVAAMMVISSAPGVSGLTRGDAAQCVEGLMYYLVVYLFMNLCAFAVVATVRNETFREDIGAYEGLVQRGGPGTVLICISLLFAFISLVGIPPFGGFFAKMLIFYGAFKAGNVHWFMWVVLAAGGLNTVFSLFYYLRVLKAVFISPPEAGAKPVKVPFDLAFIIGVFALVILALGASPLQGSLSDLTRYVATALFQ